MDPKGFAEHSLRITAPQHWSELLFSRVTFMSLYLVTPLKIVSGIHSFLLCRKLLQLIVLNYWPSLCINFIHLSLQHAIPLQVLWHFHHTDLVMFTSYIYQ